VFVRNEEEMSDLTPTLVQLTRAQQIADELIGTAKSLHDVLHEDESQDDWVLMKAVYALCFECDGCGWWASTDELHNDKHSGQSKDEMCEECFDGDDE